MQGNSMFTIFLLKHERSLRIFQWIWHKSCQPPKLVVLKNYILLVWVALPTQMAKFGCAIRPPCAKLHHNSHFVFQLDHLKKTKKTGWSSIKVAVVLKKQMAKICRLIWTTNCFCIVVDWKSVCLIKRHLEFRNHYLKIKTKTIYSDKRKT